MTGVRTIIPGHRYELAHIDGDGKTVLQFVDRDHGDDCEGIICQPLLVAMIDRVKFMDQELACGLNQEILQHLRMALAAFEARAILRKVAKGKLLPEGLPVSDDGHWMTDFRRISE